MNPHHTGSKRIAPASATSLGRPQRRTWPRMSTGFSWSRIQQNHTLRQYNRKRRHRESLIYMTIAKQKIASGFAMVVSRRFAAARKNILSGRFGLRIHLPVTYQRLLRVPGSLAHVIGIADLSFQKGFPA